MYICYKQTYCVPLPSQLIASSRKQNSKTSSNTCRERRILSGPREALYTAVSQHTQGQLEIELGTKVCNSSHSIMKVESVATKSRAVVR